MQGHCEISTALQTSVPAAGYLAAAADCRARPMSDTILDTRCHGTTPHGDHQPSAPWPGLTAVRGQVVVVVSNEWPVTT